MNVGAYRVRVEASRGSRIESRHDVYVAAIGAPALDDCLAAADCLPRAVMRSTAKPLQLLPFVARGIADELDCDAADLAVLCGSHDGTPAHADRVGQVLRRLGARPEDLHCGLHRPYFLDAHAANDPVHAHVYGPLHHNCSGNHAGLLALAKHCGVDPPDYLNPAARHHELIAGLVHAFAGEPPVVLEDNCGAPCYELPLAAIATTYRFLAAPETLRDLPAARSRLLREIAPLEVVGNAVERLVAALMQQPQWISGDSSGATQVARRVPSGLVVKHGGEGMLCVAHPESGAALAFKVADGNGRATIPALVFVLHRYGWLRADDVTALSEHAELLLHGHRGHPIGALRAVPSS